MANRENPSDIFKDIFAGGGIGVLVGLLVGLSVSEVVGSVIAGLIALLSAFFGLNIKLNLTAGDAKTKYSFHAWRIIGFGFFCSFALLAGIFLRSNNLLGQSPKQALKFWSDMGYTEEIARDMVAYQELGITPEKWKVAAIPPASPGKTVLFFEISDEDLMKCQNLGKDMYSSPEERARAFRQERGLWKRIGDAIEGIPSEKQSILMDIFWELLCEKSLESQK